MSETPVTRKLTAILYADVAGYSRLTGSDEVGTHRQLSAALDLIAARIEANGGRVVHYAGDAVLADFASVVAAVDSAVGIQKTLADQAANIPEDQRVTFRIGVNLGEVIVDRDDIYGDGVNIAARLESLAEPGGLCISDDVRRQIDGKLDLAFESMGPQEVKNIAAPVEVWRWPALSDAPSTTPTNETTADGVDYSLKTLIDSIERPTLAVLPFVNMSRNEDIEFFADGLAESLITDISNSLPIAMASRNSSFAYKGQKTDSASIAESLNVRYLIEGSAQAMGSRLRVNVQLVDSTSGNHVWADRYDRSTDDLFEAQDEICEAIMDEVNGSIGLGEASRVLNAQSTNAEAKRHANRAMRYFMMQGEKGFLKSIEEGDKALAADPDSIAGSVFSASARAQLVLHGFAANGDSLLKEALAITEDTMVRHPKAPSPPNIRSLIFLAMGEFDRAIAESQNSLSISPSSAPARHVYARALIATGKYDEAYRQTIQSVSLQPNVFPMYILTLGITCLLRDRIADAVMVLRKFQELAPQLAPGSAVLAAALNAHGASSEAERIRNAVFEFEPNITVGEILKPYRMKVEEGREKLRRLLNDAGFPD